MYLKYTQMVLEIVYYRHMNDEIGASQLFYFRILYHFQFLSILCFR